MFAPPIPAPYAHGSRPSSAAGHHPHSPASTAPATPFDVPRGHGRRSSQSWSHSTSLPPPPSEIDKYADISSALITSASPSKYDMEFGTGLTAGLDAGHDGDRKQLPMNAVSKHPKLKLEVVLTSNVFEAGGSISGRLEVTSSTSKGLRLGELAVELEGIEELSSRDHAATQTFLYNRTLFQGEHLPPSNAVLPSAPMSGYWTARKGRTTFPFSFKLPSSAPSCVTFAGNASLRYGLKATAQTWWADQKSIVTSRRDAFVVERWEDEFDEKFQQPVEAVGDTRLFMGGAGAIWLEAGVAEQLFWGGGQVVIRCGVKNNTKRQVSGIKVALARRLVFPVGADMGGRQSLEPQITEVVHEQNFKGREYEFPPNEELVCNVAVEVPRDLRTVRKTRLFEIRVVALVSLVLGTFAKDLTVEVPLYIAHTASVQRPAQPTLDALHPHPHPPRPSSSASHHPAHHHHHHHPPHEQNPDPYMRPLEQYAADRGWSPAPTAFVQLGPVQGQPQSPSRPASAAPVMIPLPPTPQPFAFSPASPGHVAWDANATGWSASQFMAPGFGGWNQQQQQQGQHLSRPGSAQNIQRPSSAAPDMQTYQQQQTMSSMPPPRQDANGALMPQWVPVQPSISASPGPMSPATRQNSMPMPTPNSHLMRRPTGGSAHFMQEGQAHRSSAPVGYQPPFSPQPQPQLQQQNQGMAPSVSTPDFSAGNGTTRSYLPPGPEARPIPPPSPVQEQESNTAPAQYHQQQRVAFPSAPDPLPVTSPSTAAGLATIEEDSESQAGTMRSIKPMGGSVTRAEVEQFEAIAANEENEEELRKALHQLGLEPDPDAFKAKETVTSSAIEEGKTLPKPPVPSDKVKSTLANRPRASDIFANAKVQQAQQALDGRQQVNRSVSAQELKADAPVAASQRSVSASNAAPAAKAAPRQRRLSSLSRADSEQGLFALEFRLSRPTTPIAPSSPSVGSPSKALPREGSLSPGKREMVLGNLAPVGEGERQRKESALRAAAREAAKREQEAREASQREKEIREAAEKENLARAAVREREERERKEEAHRAQERERAHRQRENHDRERVLTDLAAERERDRERQERRRKREERERQEAKEREARALAVAPKKAETSAPEATRAEEKNGRTDTLQNGAANAQSKASASSENLVPAAVQLSSGASAGDRSAHGGSNKSGGERKVVNPEEVRELNRQAVGRVAGWLSASSSPASSELESAPREEKVKSPPAKSISPPKPSEISSSISTSKATPPSALARNHTDRSTSMPFPSLSSTAAPVARLPKSMSASSGLASTPSRRRAVTADTDEPLPMLSPELRALVDGSTVRARAPGTALRDHPTSRRISASSSTMSVVKLGEAKDAASPASQTGNSKETATAKTGSVATPPLSSSSSVRVRERHISMPARSSDIGKPLGPAQPTASLASLDRDGAAAAVREAKADDHQDETVVPASVKKTLLASTTAAAAPASENISASASQGGLLVSDKKAYDARSARGGRGGRVTSVAQLWTTIADPQKDAAGAQKEAANTPLATVKPKPRTSGLGGAPALDFSKAPSAPALSASASTSAAAYAPPRKVTSPLLKSAAVPFLNTTMPRPSFSVASPTSPVKVAAPLAPTLALTSTSIEAKDKVAPSPATAAAVRAARRQTADFLTRPTENLSTPAAAAVSKGTNTAIGSDRLRELRAKWGG